jgi:hypothetical protein
MMQSERVVRSRAQNPTTLVADEAPGYGAIKDFCRIAAAVAKCSLDHRRNNSDQTISHEADEACRDRQNEERLDHPVGHRPPYTELISC